MFQVIAQEQNRIEIALDEVLTQEEFRQVIHQLESLVRTFGPINVLFDAAHLKTYDFQIIADEYNFYKSYRDQLKRLAIVSDRKFETFIAGMFNNFIDLDLRTFKPAEIEEARKWIFPSPLP
jgi:hypothetical protein